MDKIVWSQRKRQSFDWSNWTILQWNLDIAIARFDDDIMTRTQIPYHWSFYAGNPPCGESNCYQWIPSMADSHQKMPVIHCFGGFFVRLNNLVVGAMRCIYAYVTPAWSWMQFMPFVRHKPIPRQIVNIFKPALHAEPTCSLCQKLTSNKEQKIMTPSRPLPNCTN